jgi:hypothetical protein
LRIVQQPAMHSSSPCKPCVCGQNVSKCSTFQSSHSMRLVWLCKSPGLVKCVQILCSTIFSSQIMAKYRAAEGEYRETMTSNNIGINFTFMTHLSHYYIPNLFCLVIAYIKLLKYSTMIMTDLSSLNCCSVTLAVVAAKYGVKYVFVRGSPISTFLCPGFILLTI